MKLQWRQNTEDKERYEKYIWRKKKTTGWNVKAGGGNKGNISKKDRKKERTNKEINKEWDKEIRRK